MWFQTEWHINGCVQYSMLNQKSSLFIYICFSLALTFTFRLQQLFILVTYLLVIPFIYLKKIFFCLFVFSRAAPASYGGSQARGGIGDVAAGLHHSSQQHWILDPLSEARD